VIEVARMNHLGFNRAKAGRCWNCPVAGDGVSRTGEIGAAQRFQKL
jgi:hypothetical protein